jgi:hypothetical protein
MKTLQLEPLAIDLKEYVKRSALETDYTNLIKEDTLVCVSGKPAILYKKLDWDFQQLRQVVRSVEYQTTTRSSGLKTTSRVFGYQPRIPMRRDFCTATTLLQNQHSASEIIAEYGERIALIYREFFPDIFSHHKDWTDSKVRDEWKIKNTPFTSGIINKNNPLKYHFDAGNIKGVCSCMIGLKRSVAGGYLSVPELGLGFEISDQSLTIFDGQSLLHGVTPIQKMSGDAYRFTMVYYALHQMWKCEPLTEELARIREVKTNRERRRAGIVEEAELQVTQHGVEEGKID